MKKLLWISFFAVSLLISACTSGPVTTDVEVIKIGYLGPLTGNAASYGQDTKKAVELYFKKNPTIDGKIVEVVYEDSKCNGQDAASAVQKLINVDKVKAIIGGQCSGETLGAAPIAEQNKVIVMSPVSSSPVITTAGDYIFRVYPSDAKVGQTLAQEVLKQYKKVAMLVENTDYAQAYRKSVLAQLKDAGMTPVVDEVYNPDTSDFKTLLQKVKNQNADVLVSIPQTPLTNGLVVKQARELGITIQVFGTDTMEGKEFFEIGKNAAEGAKMVVVADDPDRADVKAFLEEFGEVQAANILAIKAYDAADVIARAIDEVGYDTDKMKEYFYKMPKVEGLGGPIQFDENGDNPLQGGSVKIAKEGNFVLQK